MDGKYVGEIAVAQLVEALSYDPEGRVVRFPVSQFFRLHYGPGVDSASNRNACSPLGIKAAGA